MWTCFFCTAEKPPHKFQICQSLFAIRFSFPMVSFMFICLFGFSSSDLWMCFFLLFFYFSFFLLSFNPNILRIKLTLVYSRLDRWQSVCPSVCLYVYLCVCLFFFLSFFCVRHEQFWCGYAAAGGWRVLNLIKTWDSKKGQEDGWWWSWGHGSV